jgi:NADPH:quinone reductase-like Zn-dependent oxidoreductase
MAIQNRGLIKLKNNGGLVVKEIPVPALRDDYLLVKTVAIALNPADWTNAEEPSTVDQLMGHDFAGIVEAVGKSVRKSFKIGDRVAGVAHGGMSVST